MYALVNCIIYTGREVYHDKALLTEGATVHSVVSHEALPPGIEVIDLDGRSVAPGFIDIQVNGGGGRLFNASPDVETLRQIVLAHRRFGTTNLLPTFITADSTSMRRATAAVRDYLQQGERGILGIHFEGPFISPEKPGAHDKRYVRPPNADDIGIICSLGTGVTLLTLAPEVVPPDLISTLLERGLLLSLGHSNATYRQAMQAFAAGIRGTTHLFNAMSQFASREPGVVGAALDDANSWTGIIVDGHHVDFAAVRVAWRAKPRGKMLLVTDAMPPVGSAVTTFALGEHVIAVREGRCVTEDGVLAGSALDMATAVRNCVQKVGIPIDEALRMASTYPAEFLGLDAVLGHIAPGYRANLTIFDDRMQVSAVVVEGEYLPER